MHIGKILEWLVICHIVGKNWHTRIPEVRNEMPSHAGNYKVFDKSTSGNKIGADVGHLIVIKCIHGLFAFLYFTEIIAPKMEASQRTVSQCSFPEVFGFISRKRPKRRRRKPLSSLHICVRIKQPRKSIISFCLSLYCRPIVFWMNSKNSKHSFERTANYSKNSSNTMKSNG